MPGVRDFGNALGFALLSIGLTLGALSISLVGFMAEKASTPTQTLIITQLPVTATQTLPPTLTPIVSPPSFTPSITSTIIAPPSCSIPAGWVPIVVQIGETLDGLALKYNSNRSALVSGNCLFSESLIPGTVIYVPQVVATNTIVACIQGASAWVKNYVVKSGDTFFNIGSRYGVSANSIKSVNCRSSDLIYVGETIWVPNVPTRTPTHTPQPGTTYTQAPPLLTEPITETVLPFTQTLIPTQTTIPATATLVPTSSPISTPTAFPTNTP